MTKYLTETDFKKMLRSISPEDSSDILAEKMKDKIIFSKDACYTITDNITYEIVKGDNSILPIITKFINDSWKKLDEDKKEDIKNMFSKFSKIFTNISVKEYLPQLISKLTNNKLKFDSYFKQLHFNNGYIDMKTKQFKTREVGKDYVTKCISRDYKVSSTKRKEKLMKELSKIYPNKKVLKAILTMLGSALTGLAVRDSYLMFLIGKSSAGKSTILDLMKHATEIYVKQIKPDTFVEGKNTDKIVNTYEKCPYIRITWLNEPKDRKFDSTFIKSWADGECNAEKLYQEGSHDFRHFSITFFTANNMPNLQVSEGVHRRMRAYEHKSKFTENDKDVDEDKNIYLANKDFKSIFEKSEESKNAFVEILVEHASEWLETKKIKLPEEFSECTETLLNMNDHIQDFIDGKLTRTNIDQNRIGKQQMLKLFNTACPNRHLTEMQLTAELKNRGIVYDRKKRFNNVQGCFIGVEEKGVNVDDEDNIDMEEYKYMKQKVKDSDDKLLFMYALLAKHKIEIDDKAIKEYVKNVVVVMQQKEEIEEVVVHKDVEITKNVFDEYKVDEDEEDEKPKKIKVIKAVEKTTKEDTTTGYVKCTEKTNPFL